MTNVCSMLMPSKSSRHVVCACLVLWISALQSPTLVAFQSAGNQARDDIGQRKPHRANRNRSKPRSVDDEALKLQAEKQDSINRLENTAAEIARQWNVRQAQARKRHGSQFQKPELPLDGHSQEPKQTPNSMGANHQTEMRPPIPPVFESDEIYWLPPPPVTPDVPSPPDIPSPPEGQSSTTADANTVATVPLEKDPSMANSMKDSSVRTASVSSFVDGPIDRLALATSLYATNQFRECLKILEAVKLRPLSIEDRQWHDYLAASCYRKLGNRDEAEGHYRSVLQRSSSTWVSKAARWWLVHIDEKSDLEQKVEKVQTTVANWRKEIDVLKSAN